MPSKTDFMTSSSSFSGSQSGRPSHAHSKRRRIRLLSNGTATWSYELDQDADNVSILVLNEANRPVRSTTGDTDAGLNSFVWDGRDDLGNTLPDGVYRLSVAATGSGGEQLASSVRAAGIVDGVEVVNGVAQLTVNGALLPLANVTSVAGIPLTDG